jgi:hypothetical protein
VSYNGQYCDFITIIGTTDEKKRREDNDNDGEYVKANDSFRADSLA